MLTRIADCVGRASWICLLAAAALGSGALLAVALGLAGASLATALAGARGSE